MTLHLDDAQTDALRARAEIEGVPVEAVAVKAIEEYIERHRRRDLIDRAVDRVLPTYGDTLRRLGE